jgi:type VI secretion system secreted protein VgrG
MAALGSDAMSIVLEPPLGLTDAGAGTPATIDTPLGSDVKFHALGGIEGLSRLFVYEIDVVSDRSDIAASELLGQSVTVHLSVGDEDGDVRHWNGRVTGLQYIDTSDDGDSRYRLTVRPWLWQLTRSADCRIFQRMSIPDIVTQVFQERGFTDFQRVLFEDYPQREYVVQYRETDFQFVSRLLEREGIYYFFRHEDGKHTLVLADSPQAHTTSPGCEQLPFAPEDEHRDATQQYMRQWKAESRLETGVFAQADYDFTKPRVQLFAQATSEDDAASGLEVYDFPGGFDNFADADVYARRRLDQSRRDAQRWTGDSNARPMAVGATFELTDHPRDDQNKSYLVTWARYRIRGEDARSTGDDEDPFTCVLVAIDAEVAFRPALSTERPMVRGPQTAMVVGPAGQEIWTDHYGRVKVQFPWDRVGKNDENSSCWIRVSQAWAGGAFGGQFVPRIGHEVIVDFLDGDPDKPIITGTVYNGTNDLPFKLPDNQTQSGVRTRSSPQGTPNNANEIRFEDMTGAEELYLQAEKDMNVLVKHDETDTIGHNRTVTVGGDDALSVGGSRAHRVAVNENVSVGVLQTVSVGAAQTVSVGAAQTVSVGAAQTVTVGADRGLKVGANEKVEVGGGRSVKVGGDLSQTVAGDVDAKTSGKTDQSFALDYTERHLGHRTIIVGSGSARRTAVVHVEGTGRAYASKSMEVEVLESFTLLCGQSQIAVTASGITLSSPNISLAGKEVDIVATTLKATMSDAMTMTAKTATVQTAGASVALDSSSATVQASQIKLSSGSGSSSPASSKPVKVTKVLMKDAQGKPRSNARVLLTKGSEQRMTVLDADGMLELVGDDAYQVSFPDDSSAK